MSAVFWIRSGGWEIKWPPRSGSISLLFIKDSKELQKKSIFIILNGSIKKFVQWPQLFGLPDTDPK
jgi:hypothetical protein